MKPLIGVTCDCEGDKSLCHNNYSKAVVVGGGLPFVLPHGSEEVLEEMLSRLDGVLITGGRDVPPERYDEKPGDKTKLVTPERDAFDSLLLDKLMTRDLPVLAICYGVQALNVAFGGTLWQDIPSQLPGALKHHREGDEPRRFHMVDVAGDTLLHRILGVERLETNSSHHQALRDVPAPLEKVAFADDGVVEAIENPEHRFMLGVQWHPESLTDREVHRKLFEAFVAEASK